MSPFLSVTVEHGVVTAAFARADRGNAYDAAMLRSLFEALARAADDAAVRAFVLRGEGRHFCCGADIGANGDAKAGEEGGPAVPDVCWRLDTLPKPTIAVVQGACIGGGLALAACCDLVIAEQAAFFAMPEIRLGFAPGPLIPFVLRAIGYRQARRLLLTGERFSAEEAARIGLVHVLCDAGKGDEALRAALSEVMQAAPKAAAATKAMTRRLAGVAITPKLLDDLEDAFRAAAGSDEAREGLAAFSEKRPPRWS